MEGGNHAGQKRKSEDVGDLVAYCKLVKRVCHSTLMGLPHSAEVDNSNLDLNAENFEMLPSNRESPYTSGEGNDSSAQPLVIPMQYTFESRGQRRTGCHHGRGWKGREPSIREDQAFADLTRVVIAHLLVELCGTKQEASDLLCSFGNEAMEKGSIDKRFQALCSRKINPYRIAKLPGPVIGISANFNGLPGSRSNFDHEWNSGEAHAICTWIDDNGGVRLLASEPLVSWIRGISSLTPTARIPALSEVFLNISCPLPPTRYKIDFGVPSQATSWK